MNRVMPSTQEKLWSVNCCYSWESTNNNTNRLCLFLLKQDVCAALFTVVTYCQPGKLQITEVPVTSSYPQWRDDSENAKKIEHQREIIHQGEQDMCLHMPSDSYPISHKQLLERSEDFLAQNPLSLCTPGEGLYSPHLTWWSLGLKTK